MSTAPAMGETDRISIRIDKTEPIFTVANQKQHISKETLTLVLVGKTGNGKSATGNGIIGRNVFYSSLNHKSVAKNVVAQTSDLRQNQIIEIIDTPGLFDTSVGYKIIGNEIIQSINLATNGIHVLLIVLSVRNRFSEAEESAVYYLFDLFGEKILKYVVFVFTGGDNLDEEEDYDIVNTVNDEPLKVYLRDNCPESLQEILNLCGNRMVLFNNKTKDESKKSEQVKKLFYLVDEVIAQNGGEPYTRKNCGEEVIMRLQGKELGIGEKTSFLTRKIEKAQGKHLEQMTIKLESKFEGEKIKLREENAQQIEELEARKQQLAEQMKELEINNNYVFNDTKTVVLVGKSGTGKSEIGNSIIGRRAFDSCYGTVSAVARTRPPIKGQIIEVINTPDWLFHTSAPYETVRKEISECIDLTTNGIHAIFLVLSLRNQFSKEEESAVKLLQLLFGKELYDYVTVVVTAGDSHNSDEEGEDDKRLDDYICRPCPKSLMDILKLCGSRIVLFDDQTTNQNKKMDQVDKLLTFVDKVVTENGTMHGKDGTLKLKTTKVNFRGRFCYFSLGIIACAVIAVIVIAVRRN